jgi:hypothetical protein
MGTGVAGSGGATWNIVARLRQRHPKAPGPVKNTPEAARLQAAMDMHELGVRLYRQRMHREHPQAARTDIDRMVRAWLAGSPRSGRLRLPSRERGRDIR